MRLLLLVLLCFIFPAAAADLRALQQGATVILQQNTVSIAPSAATGASLSTAQEVDWVLDYSVDGKSTILLTLITEEQYQSLSAGKPAGGKAIATSVLAGSSSFVVRLPAGRYFVAFTNQSPAPVRLTYRASALRPAPAVQPK